MYCTLTIVVRSFTRELRQADRPINPLHCRVSRRFVYDTQPHIIASALCVMQRFQLEIVELLCSSRNCWSLLCFDEEMTIKRSHVEHMHHMAYRRTTSFKHVCLKACTLSIIVQCRFPITFAGQRTNFYFVIQRGSVHAPTLYTQWNCTPRCCDHRIHLSASVRANVKARHLGTAAIRLLRVLTLFSVSCTSSFITPIPNTICCNCVKFSTNCCPAKPDSLPLLSKGL